jgi:hypothetical protein
VGGLDPVHHIVRNLLPYAKRAHWSAVLPEATEHEVHYFPVEARRGVTLKLSHWSLGEVGKDVVQDFRQGWVLALAAGLPILPLCGSTAGQLGGALRGVRTSSFL